MDPSQAEQEQEWMREWMGPDDRAEAFDEAMAAGDGKLAWAIARFPLSKDRPEEDRRQWGARRDMAQVAAGDPDDAFAGRRLAGMGWVRDGDRLLVPAESLAVSNHAPSGFAWGYPGSGPSQLALALLLRVAPREEALPAPSIAPGDVPLLCVHHAPSSKDEASRGGEEIPAPTGAGAGHGEAGVEPHHEWLHPCRHGAAEGCGPGPGGGPPASALLAGVQPPRRRGTCASPAGLLAA